MDTTQTIRWAVYVRKSDDDRKVTEKSNAEQLQEAQILVGRQGLNVVATFEESKSALVPGKRPLYAEMIQRIERGEIDGIVCWHINRLVRNMTEGGKLADMLAHGQVKQILTPTSSFQTGDNIIPLVVEAATSTQYSLENIRNVRRGMKGHFESGGTTYKAPAGYRNDRHPDNTKRGIVVRDEPRFSLIRRAFAMFMTGAYSLEEVRTELNERWGYRSRRGYPLSPAGMYKLIREPYYMGRVRFAGGLAQGNHEPMLTPAEFRRVQEVVTGRRRIVQPKTRIVLYPFAGMLRCAYCNQQVTVGTHIMRNGKPYVSYHCSDSWRACTKKGMSEEALDAAMAGAISFITLDDDLASITLSILLRSLDNRYSQITADRGRHIDQLAAVDQKLWRLEKMYLDGLFDSEERYRQHLSAVKAERLQISELSSGVGGQLSLEEARQGALNAVWFLNRASHAFRSGEMKTKREIASALATGYRFFGREKRVEMEVDPILVEVVTYARSLPPTLQPEVKTDPNRGTRLFKLSKSGSSKWKTTPARAVVFAGRPAESSSEPDEHLSVIPAGLIELIANRAFPLVEL